METRGEKWWTNHILHTRGYLEAAMASDQERALKELRALWQAILKWQAITGSWVAALLMAEHTALAKLLIDGLARKAGAAWTGTATEALLLNVDSHRKLFPKAPQAFAELFDRHTRLAGSYSADLAHGLLQDFEAHFAEALRNGAELARITDRLFPGRALPLAV